MADTFWFVQGALTATRTLNINNSSTYKVLSANMSVPTPETLWHQPDYGERRVVRYVDGDREVILRMKISGTDDDAIFDAIKDLREWVYDAHRAELGLEVEPIYLLTKVNGQGILTKHRIKAGVIDDSAGHFTPERQRKDIALDVIVRLILAPYGERADSSGNQERITLRNMLTSSPHFVEDSNSDGLADGWNELDAGSVTTTIDTDDYLIGGQSQKVVAGAASEGIYTDTVTNAADTTAVAFAWVAVTAGDVYIELYDVDVATPGTVQRRSLDSTDSGGVSTDSYVGTGGKTWYKVVCAGTFAAGNDMALRIYSNGGAATFYVDACYLELGTDTAPAGGWCSAVNIDNRNDIQSTSAATENYLHYIDVWSLPGDADAAIKFRWTVTETNPLYIFYAGRMTDGVYPAAEQPTWIISDDFNASENNTNGAWDLSDSEVGASEADHIISFLASGTPASGTAYATFSGAAARKLLATERRVFVRAKASNGGEAATLTLSTSGVVCHDAKVATFTAHSKWELLDIGTIRGVGVLPAETPKSTSPTINFKISIAALPNTEEIWIDAVILMPTTEFLIAKTATQIDSADDIWIDGIQQAFMTTDTAQREPATAGTLWNCPAGRRNMSRFVFAMTDENNQHTLTDSFAGYVDILPRTRHLMDR